MILILTRQDIFMFVLIWCLVTFKPRVFHL